jgi:CHASE2 domain-containing sensor protein
MNLDKHTLNLAAAALSAVGALVGLGSALFGRNKGTGSVIPSLLGVAGSVAWVMSALHDVQDERPEPA